MPLVLDTFHVLSYIVKLLHFGLFKDGEAVLEWMVLEMGHKGEGPGLMSTDVSGCVCVGAWHQALETHDKPVCIHERRASGARDPGVVRQDWSVNHMWEKNVSKE